MSRSDAGSSPTILQLGDDLAAGLLFLDLFGQEPLQLGHRGERLLVEGRLVERVDLPADFLFLLERALEHVEQRGERLPRLSRAA